MNELTPEQRRQIYLEEQARLEARRELGKERKTGCGAMIGYILLAAFAGLVLLAIIGGAMDSKGKHVDSSQAVAGDAGNPVTGNRAVDMMLTSSEDIQAKVLEANVDHAYAENGTCNAVRIFYMGQGPKNVGWWSIACGNGHSYEVEIEPNATGSSSVTDCDILKALHTDVCFRSVEEMKRMK
jgi:hypothetical protein